MLGGGDRTSLAGARGLEPECRNQKNRSHVDRSLFAIQPAVNDFNFQAAATYLAHGPSAASEERSYGSFSRAIPCRSIQKRKSRRSLIRAYCESNCQSRRRWRRSSKRSRSRKPKALQDLPPLCDQTATTSRIHDLELQDRPHSILRLSNASTGGSSADANARGSRAG